MDGQVESQVGKGSGRMSVSRTDFEAENGGSGRESGREGVR